MVAVYRRGIRRDTGRVLQNARFRLAQWHCRNTPLHRYRGKRRVPHALDHAAIAHSLRERSPARPSCSCSPLPATPRRRVIIKPPLLARERALPRMRSFARQLGIPWRAVVGCAALACAGLALAALRFVAHYASGQREIVPTYNAISAWSALDASAAHRWSANEGRHVVVDITHDALILSGASMLDALRALEANLRNPEIAIVHCFVDRGSNPRSALVSSPDGPTPMALDGFLPLVSAIYKLDVIAVERAQQPDDVLAFANARIGARAVVLLARPGVYFDLSVRALDAAHVRCQRTYPGAHRICADVHARARPPVLRSRPAEARERVDSPRGAHDYGARLAALRAGARRQRMCVVERTRACPKALTARPGPHGALSTHDAVAFTSPVPDGVLEAVGHGAHEGLKTVVDTFARVRRYHVASFLVDAQPATDPLGGGARRCRIRWVL